MTEDLTAWLLKQIAEDEALARDEAEVRARWQAEYESAGAIGVVVNPFDDPGSPGDPVRVLAECDAKRLILAEHRRYDEWAREVSPGAAPPYPEPSCVGCGLGSDEEPRTAHIDQCPTLRALALPYASRSDYLEEWRPDTPST